MKSIVRMFSSSRDHRNSHALVSVFSSKKRIQWITQFLPSSSLLSLSSIPAFLPCNYCSFRRLYFLPPIQSLFSDSSLSNSVRKSSQYFDNPCPGSSNSMTPTPVSPTKRQLSTSPLKSSSPLKKLKSEEEENIMPTITTTNENEIKVEDKKGSIAVTGDVELKKELHQPKLYFAKMTDKAHVPTRGSKFSAGYDLKSAYKYTVPARGSGLIKTDIQIKLPSGTYGRVAPRSGLALKNKIDVGAGVIDEDYRGNVGVILFNHSDTDFEVNEGDRIAQLICQKIYYPEAVELENLDETERGEGGFGSTGVNEQKA